MSGALAAIGGSGRAALTATCSPGIVTAIGPGSVLTTNSATCTASGGGGGYTYLWALASGANITITTATAASTTFKQTGGGVTIFNDTANCTVTSGSESVVATQTVAIDIERT